MKSLYVPIFTAIILAGCSSTKPTGSVEPAPITAINAQKLQSNFTRQGIKIEWDCTVMNRISNFGCENANIKSIEVTAYANSNGNTEVNKEIAYRMAEVRAKAKLRHFLNEEITSTNTVKTLSKNVEKANDRIKQRITNTEEVLMSDSEAEKDTNWSIRENNNNIVTHFIENVQKSAQGILRGVYVHKQNIVDRQTVEVTIRWDTDSQKASNQLRKAFGN